MSFERGTGKRAFREILSWEEGWNHVQKPTIPCRPREACTFIQPDHGAVNQRTGEAAVGDSKDKKRIATSDILKLADDARRAKADYAFLIISCRTRISDHMLRTASRRGINVIRSGNC